MPAMVAAPQEKALVPSIWEANHIYTDTCLPKCHGILGKGLAATQMETSHVLQADHPAWRR